MDDKIDFRYSVLKLPNGEALTESEMEQRLLKTLDEKNGDCPHTLWDLARYYQRVGHVDQATLCMARIVELVDDPEKVGACFLSLGQFEESRGDYSAAVIQYRKALVCEPNSPHVWYLIHNNLGYSLNQIGEHKVAIPYLKKALEIEPGRPNAYKNLGLALEALEETSKAAEMFIAATQVNASDPRALSHLITMMEKNPELEVDIPDLLSRVDACLTAVKIARNKQPDLKAHWEKLRKQQRPH